MRHDITFSSNGIPISGHLYLPPSAVPLSAVPLSAVVVGHPAGGVKEQAAGLYARRLADAGFAALTFDAAYQGESGGLPRGLEDPAQRVEDLRSAVSFLTTRPEVDPDRLGMLGICASGGYVVPAAATDPRVRAVATVSAVDVGSAFRHGFDGRQGGEAAAALIAEAAKARTAAARTGEVALMPIFPADEEQARAADRHTFEGWEYYCTDRGAHPRSTTQMPWQSIDRILTFDAFAFVERIAPRPLLMIAGTEAVTLGMSERVLARAGDSARLETIEGATHVDLYDREHFVGPAVALLAEFFTDGLNAV